MVLWLIRTERGRKIKNEQIVGGSFMGFLLVSGRGEIRKSRGRHVEMCREEVSFCS